MSKQHLTPFTKDNQPSGEAKSAGWKKRKDLITLIEKYKKMSIFDFRNTIKKMEKAPSKFTMEDLTAMKAVQKMAGDFRWYSDERDRTEGKAVSKVEISGKDGQPIGQIINNSKMTDDEAMRIYLETLKNK